MTKLPESRELELELERGWLRIWINRPESRNALNAGLAAEIIAVLEAVRNDPSVRGITLRGRGGVFCAGADLRMLSELSAMPPVEARAAAERMSRHAADLYRCVRQAPQLTVALVEGAAMAGGFGLTCAVDIVAATRDTQFSLTETLIGLTPAQIAPYVIERVGVARGRRLMLTAARLNGEEAYGVGLVDHLAAAADELDRIESGIVNQVMRCAPGAIAATKRVIGATGTLSHEDLVTLAADSFAECLAGEEGREGIASFLERRSPGWSS